MIHAVDFLNALGCILPLLEPWAKAHIAQMRVAEIRYNIETHIHMPQFTARSSIVTTAQVIPLDISRQAARRRHPIKVESSPRKDRKGATK